MSSSLRIHQNQIIQQYKNGIKLLPPSDHFAKGHTLTDVMDIPLNIYAYDLFHRLQFSNTQSNRLCGFQSENDVLGRHIEDFMDKQSANELILHNKTILKQANFKIFDEYVLCNTQADFLTITLKFPWYDNNKKIIGVFGYSIPLCYEGLPPLAQSITLLSKLGLINSSLRPESVFPGSIIDGVYLSQREKEVLIHLIRGKTTKEVSKILQISHRTVETYINNSKNKLLFRTKSELIEKVFDFFYIPR